MFLYHNPSTLLPRNKGNILFGLVDLLATAVLYVDVCEASWLENGLADPTNASSALQCSSFGRKQVRMIIQYLPAVLCFHVVVLPVALEDTLDGSWLLVPVVLGTLVPLGRAAYSGFLILGLF